MSDCLHGVFSVSSFFHCPQKPMPDIPRDFHLPAQPTPRRPRPKRPPRRHPRRCDQEDGVESGNSDRLSDVPAHPLRYAAPSGLRSIHAALSRGLTAPAK